MQLQLECLNVCDCSCKFCPYPTMVRPKKLMSMPLFKKIIDEAATVQRFTQVTLTGLGETLLDRHLDDRIVYIRSKMPYITLDMYTNGTQLTVERGMRLAERGLSILYVSLNAASREKRREIMGVDDYDEVVTNLHGLIDAIKASGSPMAIRVKAVQAKDLMEGSDVQRFMEEWGGPYDKGGNAFTHLEGNWAGATYPMRTKMSEACSRALSEIMVLSDGRVALCCFDGEGQVILGDLNTQTLREVFAGDKAVEYRKAHLEGRRQELLLCATCTGI